MTYDCIGRFDFVLVRLCLCCLRFSVPLGSVVCCISLILENSSPLYLQIFLLPHSLPSPWYCPTVSQFFHFCFFVGHALQPVGLVSWQRDWTQALGVKAPSPNHWIAREFPSYSFKILTFDPPPSLFSPCVSFWIISNVLSSSYLVCWWFYYKNSWSLILYFLSLTFTF